MTLRAALAAGPLVLDGGLATHLETLGHDLSDELWSARLLRDDPAALVRAHADHLRAGAQVLVTASYQASVEGLVAHGADDAEARRLIQSSVARAREAADLVGRGSGEVWVAGSVGPYGAVLAGGQEYTGDYLDPTAPGALDLEALRRFHAERMALLVAAGADVLACETVPGWLEVGAMLLAAEDTGADVWLSLTAVQHTDDPPGTLRTRRGEPVDAERLADVASHSRVVAVGVNCCEPAAATAATALGATVVYPNSGEVWDPEARSWTGEPAPFDGLAAGWLDEGARLVGGCCRVTPQQVADMAATVDQHLRRR